MPDRYATPPKGSSDWNEPLNENFSDLDIDVEHRGTTDPDTAGVTPASGAKFLDTSTGEIYTADGSSWTLQWDLGAIGSGGGGDVDYTTVEGIDSTPEHVGPMYSGTHHNNAGFGTVFWAASGLQLQSTVVDTDLSSISTTTLPIHLTHYEDGAADPTVVGTVDATVSGGPERVDISSLPAIPSDGEYVLARPASSNGEIVPCRRIQDFGTEGFDEHTYPSIDFLRGTDIDLDQSTTGQDNYYYFFDIQIGDSVPRVTSPWSTDIDEIYMRPRDPVEEFDNVSPRAMWYDTS